MMMGLSFSQNLYPAKPKSPSYSKEPRVPSDTDHSSSDDSSDLATSQQSTNSTRKDNKALNKVLKRQRNKEA